MLPHCCKIRTLNYRVVINDGYCYEVLRRTSARCAVSSRPLARALSVVARSIPPSGTVGRHRFNGRALKTLHLNTVKDKEGLKGQEDEEKKVQAPLKNRTEKESKKTQGGNRHSSSYRQQHHHHHHHRRRRRRRRRRVAPLQQQQEQQKEQQRCVPEIKDDQHEVDLADSSVRSLPAAHIIYNGGRISGPAVGKKLSTHRINTTDCSPGIPVRQKE